MIFEEKMNGILTLYKQMNDRYKTELMSSPDGSLLHQMKGKYVQFLHSTIVDGKRVRPGINRNQELIKALARKEFAKAASEILDNNIGAIEEAISKQVEFDPDQILRSMTKAYALLPEEYFFDREKLIIDAGLDGDTQARIRRHEAWGKRPYKEYWGYPENKTKTTSRGQKVRSISELLIAETLYKYSIPFHYEEEIEICGKVFAPDFTFEGYDQMFYLDYFGMMDDMIYAKRNFRKLNDYYDIGLVPGNNLIIAFDAKGIMNVSVIEGIIKNEVIPRL